ncbi:uncharacterized protein DSM5745_07283 [Aspergillus mulundensis]|uniref:Uncharacterized protein n=1 Tax=Aspergillus mulundensis TaxID=1810919 RepID=A0A3D8RLD6_9EURO|nr:hypothetical protein DSM5745_07283 [Aspergillus mulundensis]RDW74621.1 hypothetical protein DSM5745_07283 [Aspergillus mulundensis]
MAEPNRFYNLVMNFVLTHRPFSKWMILFYALMDMFWPGWDGHINDINDAPNEQWHWEEVWEWDDNWDTDQIEWIEDEDEQAWEWELEWEEYNGRDVVDDYLDLDPGRN